MTLQNPGHILGICAKESINNAIGTPYRNLESARILWSMASEAFFVKASAVENANALSNE